MHTPKCQMASSSKVVKIQNSFGFSLFTVQSPHCFVVTVISSAHFSGIFSCHSDPVSGLYILASVRFQDILSISNTECFLKIKRVLNFGKIFFYNYWDDHIFCLLYRMQCVKMIDLHVSSHPLTLRMNHIYPWCVSL